MKREAKAKRAMERKMLNVKLKDRICNTIIRQRTRVTDKVHCITSAKWKWVGHIAKDRESWRTTFCSERTQPGMEQIVSELECAVRANTVPCHGVLFCVLLPDIERQPCNHMNLGMGLQV